MTYFLSYLCIIWLTLFMKESKAVLAEETLKYVCCGDSIQLFRNVTIDYIDMIVTLYVKASNERILAMWTSKNTTISDGYTRKVFLDKNGDIWIHNVSPSDEAQYILMTGKGTNFLRYNVTLSLQVAPTINCKPTIIRVNDVLVASLDAKECGKPVVSVDWLNDRGNHNKGNEFMLPKTNKYGIFYACINGSAIKCAKTSKLSDYCTAYPISDTHEGHDVSSNPGIEQSEPKYFVVILVAILLVLGLVIFGLLLLFLSKYKNGTLCWNRKRTEDAEKRDYNAVPTTTELSVPVGQVRSSDQRNFIRFETWITKGDRSRSYRDVSPPPEKIS